MYVVGTTIGKNLDFFIGVWTNIALWYKHWLRLFSHFEGKIIECWLSLRKIPRLVRSLRITSLARDIKLCSLLKYSPMLFYLHHLMVILQESFKPGVKLINIRLTTTINCTLINIICLNKSFGLNVSVFGSLIIS